MYEREAARGVASLFAAEIRAAAPPLSPRAGDRFRPLGIVLQ